LDSNGEPIEVLELKRSFYSLQDWKPYQDDFVNFNLLLSVCQQADMKMNIAYNVRETKPVFKDDASRFAIFSFSSPSAPKKIGLVNYSDFLKGDY
jgi:hypothetical protein